MEPHVVKEILERRRIRCQIRFPKSGARDGFGIDLELH